VSLDAYLNVHDGRSYPPILLRSGTNDVRVPRWQSDKFAARLQQATTSSNPVLLRLSGGGHINGATSEEEAMSDAEAAIFALSSLKHPDFQ